MRHVEFACDRPTWWHLAALCAAAIYFALLLRPMTFLYPWGYCLLALLFVVFLLWQWRCSPRVLCIDTETAVASFLPACRCRITSRQPIVLRKFSSVYWRGGGKCYSVELVNPRGEDRVLHVFASEAAAEQLCRLISEQFGLRNRGYMG